MTSTDHHNFQYAYIAEEKSKARTCTILCFGHIYCFPIPSQWLWVPLSPPHPPAHPKKKKNLYETLAYVWPLKHNKNNYCTCPSPCAICVTQMSSYIHRDFTLLPWITFILMLLPKFEICYSLAFQLASFEMIGRVSILATPNVVPVTWEWGLCVGV